MDWIAALLRWIVRLLNVVAASIQMWIIKPCQSDQSYRTGFLWGTVIIVALIVLSWQLGRWWKAVTRYFSPIDHGPSPVQIYAGCVAGIIKIILVLLIVGALFITILSKP